MPLIIAPEDYERWLDAAVDEDVTDLLPPYPAESMAYYPVSTRVNAVRNDDASIIERAVEAKVPEAEPEPEAADGARAGAGEAVLAARRN